MNPVDINGKEIKVGDIIRAEVDSIDIQKGFLYKVTEVFDDAVYVFDDISDDNCLFSEYVTLVQSADNVTDESSSIFVDDNGKVIKDNLEDTTSNPLKVQYGGTHYKDKAIQPIEYILANDLNFCEGNAIKYLTRWRDKGGVEDLKKAKHYIDFLIEKEESGK